MSAMFDLAGRVAVVTGGNRGIGLGMAKGLASAGSAVVVAARDRAKSEEAVAALAAAGAKSAFVALDVADPASCRDMVRQTVERFGRLDILVNNAGINARRPPQDYTLDEWQRVLDVNLTGVFSCAQAAYAPMKQGGSGKIINVGSIFSIFGASFATVYSTSKGAIVQLTKSLATAWAKDDIQVNAILPGFIDTEMTRAARQQVPGMHERVLNRTPAGRWGVPEDLAGITVFLAARASNFVTGAVIPVDGGFSAEI